MNDDDDERNMAHKDCEKNVKVAYDVTSVDENEIEIGAHKDCAESECEISDVTSLDDGENANRAHKRSAREKKTVRGNDTGDDATVHLGITPIYGSFVKSPCDSQPLQFHGHNFTVVRTSNQSSFVDRSTKLHTLAVTRRLFGPAGEKRFKTANPGSYTEGFRSSENFALQQNFHI